MDYRVPYSWGRRNPRLENIFSCVCFTLYGLAIGDYVTKAFGRIGVFYAAADIIRFLGLLPKELGRVLLGLSTIVDLLRASRFSCLRILGARSLFGTGIF